jgi:hypothetical protein
MNHVFSYLFVMKAILSLSMTHCKPYLGLSDMVAHLCFKGTFGTPRLLDWR